MNRSSEYEIQLHIICIPNIFGTQTVSTKLPSSIQFFGCQIWRQFVYISKRGIDEQKVRQYLSSMFIQYNVYPYMKYMLKRLGTIAGYEHILCSRIFRGTWLLDVYSDLVQAQVLCWKRERSLGQFRVRFSSLQQQTQHIICVSIADHSRRWLLSLWFATMI